MRMSLVCVALFASCARPQVAEPAPLPLAAIALPSVISRTPLGRDATGVSIDAQGQRFVWIRGVGLHQVTSEGLVLTLPLTLLGINPPPDFEDVAIIDANRVALIAKNEGFVVGRTTGQQLSRFCYLPPEMQQNDPSAWQVSHALAYDAQEDRLYVQPQTFTGYGTLTGSQLGLFDPALPTPLEWQSFGERTFSAGGMAVTSRQHTWLGSGTRLYQYDATARTFANWWDLEGLVSRIEGLAYDRQAGTVVVLDGEARELVELRLEGP